MKKMFKLQGLDCANCAAKIENMIKSIEGINDASISFMTCKMVIEFDEKNRDEIMQKVKKIIKREDPDIKIQEI